MHTIITPPNPATRLRSADFTGQHACRHPDYDCREQSGAVELVVYVPGVAAAGVQIETNGPDLVITARKVQFVRPNWTALHLESAQKDYQLRLRLGRALDYRSMHAALHNGILTVVLPKLAHAQIAAGSEVKVA